ETSLVVSSRLLVSTRATGPRGALLDGLADLVADRRDRLEVLRDRRPVGRGEVLVSGQRALDDLAHEPAGDVAVRLVAAAEIVGDLLDRPLADARLGVRCDVRHRLVLRPLRVAGEKAAV